MRRRSSDENAGQSLFGHWKPQQDEPKTKALIGVSGGRDSIALLHALIDAGYTDLIVCHFDHQLRKESREDAGFVRSLTKSLGLRYVEARADIVSKAKRRKQSIETAAREARYLFFARTAAKYDASRLFLAHHADDQIETLLFNLLRGTGSAGLGGMRMVTQRTIGEVTLEIVRPLLAVWREDIDRYVEQHRLAFREDASNQDLQYSRNRIRHSLLPALEFAFGRDVRRALWRSAEILQAEDQWLASMPILDHAQDETLSVAQLRTEGVAAQRRLIHAWLRFHGIPNVGFDEVEKVRGLISGSYAKTNLPGNRHARRRSGKLFLTRLSKDGTHGNP